jgi:hypothetical protein
LRITKLYTSEVPTESIESIGLYSMMHLRGILYTVLFALLSAWIAHSVVIPIQSNIEYSSLTVEELCWNAEPAIHSWEDGRMCWNEIDDSLNALLPRYQICIRTREEAVEAATAKKQICMAHFEKERAEQSILSALPTLPELISSLPDRFSSLLAAAVPFKLLVANAAPSPQCSNHGALVTAAPLACQCDDGWLKQDCSLRLDNRSASNM